MKRKMFFIWLLFILLGCQTEVKFNTNHTIKAAVFNGFGASPKCISDAVEALKIDKEISPVIISADDIVNNQLNEVDVLVFAGGSGSRQMSNLGDMAAEKIREFVLKQGGGVVGICAGAYLLSTTPEYTCLRLCPVQAIDRDHDERGHGVVQFSLTEAGKEIFPELGEDRVYYSQYYEGPVLIPAGGENKQYAELATMLSDVHLENNAPANMTNNRPFLLSNTDGEGRVFLTIGHPENTPGMRWIIPRMARWVADRELISYPREVVRPHRDSSEVLFDKNLLKTEQESFSDLIFGDSDQKITATRNLVKIRSWGAKERIAGLIRDDDVQVRLAAAEALTDLEHTVVLKDLMTIIRLETDPEIQQKLKQFADKLALMCH